MLYAILCYDSEADVGSWTREQDAAAITKLDVVQDGLARVPDARVPSRLPGYLGTNASRITNRNRNARFQWQEPQWPAPHPDGLSQAPSFPHPP